MGSPAGASSNFPGASASVYTPVGQGAADTSLQSLMALFPTDTASTPAGSYYGLARDMLANYITGSPYQDQALTSASDAAAFSKDTAFPQTTGESAALDAAGASTLPYGQTALSYGYDPQYTTNVTAAETNPYYAPALTGAQQASDIGTAGATTIASGANQVLKNALSPEYSLKGSADQVLNTAFDPERSLYKAGQANTLDYANVTNSMAGLGGTPYGSRVASGALTNYDLGWQDRQLGRQEKGLAAADAVYSSDLTRQEKGLSTADTALSDASKLAYTSSGYPSSVYTKNLADITKALDARNTGAAAGAATDKTILGTTAAADTTAQGLDSAALKDYSYYGQLPYKTGVGVATNNITGINDVVNIGDAQYKLPQQAIQDLESYLKLGQASSSLSGSLGATGLSELSGATSGIGSLASTANNLTGGGVTSGLGSLFGTGGSTVAADYGGGGAALGVADQLGGVAATDAASSSGITALLPALGSA